MHTSYNHELRWEFYDNNPNPLLQIELDGTLHYANMAGFELLGAPSDRDPADVRIPEHWHALIAALCETRETAEFEHYSDGKVFACTFVPALDTGHIHVYGVDITAHRRAKDAQHDTEEQLRSLLASIDDLVFSVDLDGHILVYHQAADTFHDTPITPSRLFIGKHYTNVLSEDVAQPLTQAIEQVKSTLKTERFVYSVRRSRELRYYNARVSPLIAPDIRLIGFTVVASDVTAATRARQRQQRMLELEQLHRTITAQFLQSDELEDALQRVLALAGKTLDVSRAYVFHYCGDQSALDNTHEWCAPGVSPQRIVLQNLPVDDVMPSWISMLTTDGMIAPYQDVSELPDDIQRFFATRDAQTVLVLPFFVDNRLQGVVGLDEIRAPRRWEPEEIAVVRAIIESYARMLERYNARRELIRARDAALQSVRLKSEFISNISHEIRTPLMHALTTLELLCETELDEQQQDFAASALYSSHHLLDMIDDMLDFSHLETGKLELDLKTFDIRAIVREIKTTMQPHTRSKQIALSTHVAPDVPTLVRGDPVRLRQVLANLVSNGIKFTPAGSVQLRVQQMKSTPPYSSVRFTVLDTGIGIPTEHQDHIFDSFVQVDGSTTRRYNGTGLGLALAQQLVQLMGGTISVRSDRGQGSAFEFTLTLKVADWPGANQD